MGFDAGKGATIGGAATPSQREWEATAHVETSRMVLGITLDSLSKPISDIDRDATWKYKSSANNPTIPPLSTLRIASKPATEDDQKWVDQLKKLLNALPPDVREELLSQSALSPEERDPAYVALDTVLGNLSQFLDLLEKAGTPSPLGEVRVELNNALGSIGLNGAYFQTLEILGEVVSYLNDVGHQDPQFEILSKFSSEIQADLDDIKEYLRTNNKKELSKLAQEMESTNHQFQRLYAGDQLNILSSMMDVLTLVVAAKTLNANNAALLIGLTAAFTGFFEKGSVFQDLIGHLSNALLPLITDGNAGEELLLPLLTTAFLTGALIFSTLGSDELVQDFSSHLLLSSGTLNGILESFASACGIKDSKTFSSVIGLVMVLALVEVSQNNLESLSPYLKDYINQLDQAVQEGKITLPESIAILLKQGLMSLEDQELPLVQNNIDEAEEILREQAKEDLKKQLLAFANFIQLLRSDLTAKDNTMNSVDTAILQA